MLSSAASIVIALAVLGLGADRARSTSQRLLAGAGGATVAHARPANQAPDGATLKSTAPIPESPTNNQIIASVPAPVLICTVATGRFVSSTFEYHFEVWVITSEGTTTLVEASTVRPGTGRAIYPIRSALGDGGSYRWRVRAELAGFAGPWSIWATFVTQDDWTLLYAEDFSTPLNGAVIPWVWDGFSAPFDAVMDDAGLWYQNDYGPDWNTAFNSFATYRKEFLVGQDGWLTASLSARDWDKDGVIDAPPSITIQAQGHGYVAVLHVPDHTGGAIFRPTNKLPSQYRNEYKLKTIDFGGKRNGSIEYDGRINGYSTKGCKTQHPWGEGSNSPGWTGDASVPYCEWQDVREGPYGYNGFHFLSIVDFANPAPRNLHFWHYRRKVLIDAFSQHPDRVGSGTGGRVCNANTNQYYNYRDGTFNTVNMWISGLPEWTPGPGELVWPNQWPAESAYPDYFVIGDLYTNAYEGSASLTDIRLYVPK